MKITWTCLDCKTTQTSLAETGRTYHCKCRESRITFTNNQIHRKGNIQLHD